MNLFDNSIRQKYATIHKDATDQAIEFYRLACKSINYLDPLNQIRLNTKDKFSKFIRTEFGDPQLALQEFDPKEITAIFQYNKTTGGSKLSKKLEMNIRWW
jgi:hypothetical protein